MIARLSSSRTSRGVLLEIVVAEGLRSSDPCGSNESLPGPARIVFGVGRSDENLMVKVVGDWIAQKTATLCRATSDIKGSVVGVETAFAVRR